MLYPAWTHASLLFLLFSFNLHFLTHTKSFLHAKINYNVKLVIEHLVTTLLKLTCEESPWLLWKKAICESLSCGMHVVWCAPIVITWHLILLLNRFVTHTYVRRDWHNPCSYDTETFSKTKPASLRRSVTCMCKN